MVTNIPQTQIGPEGTALPFDARHGSQATQCLVSRQKSPGSDLGRFRGIHVGIAVPKVVTPRFVPILPCLEWSHAFLDGWVIRKSSHPNLRLTHHHPAQR
jgi:hypothetical protein